MSTVYHFPDGVIRWAGENPSNRNSCMFYELDSAGLNINEMNRTAENMDILISAILKAILTETVDKQYQSCQAL